MFMMSCVEVFNFSIITFSIKPGAFSGLQLLVLFTLRVSFTAFTIFEGYYHGFNTVQFLGALILYYTMLSWYSEILSGAYKKFFREKKQGRRP